MGESLQLVSPRQYEEKWGQHCVRWVAERLLRHGEKSARSLAASYARSLRHDANEILAAAYQELEQGYEAPKELPSPSTEARQRFLQFIREDAETAKFQSGIDLLKRDAEKVRAEGGGLVDNPEYPESPMCSGIGYRLWEKYFLEARDD